MERIKAVKFITVMVLAVLTLAIACPSFSITSNAAENSHTVFFNFSSSTWYTFFTHTPQVTSQTTAFDNFAITEDLQGVTYIANSKKEIANYVVDGRSLVVTYPSISCTFKISPSSIATTDGFFDGMGLYFVDNLGRKYQLDIENGGTFVINDTAGLTDLSLYALGTVNGTLTTNYSSRYTFCAILKSFNISVSPGNIIRTITDSEGTVWTVPEGVENPVIVKAYDTQRSVLIDAVDGLCYASYPDNPDLHFYCAAESKLLTVYLEDGTKQYSSLLTTEDAEKIGIEPVYCTEAWRFTEFLYGSLPDMEVTPLTPDPTETPSPDDFGEIKLLGEINIDPAGDSGLVYEQDVTVSGGWLRWKTKTADYIDFPANVDSNYNDDRYRYLRHALVEDYCQKFIGRFTVRSTVDGYTVMDFPDLWIYPELDTTKVSSYVGKLSDLDIFPTNDKGYPETAVISNYAEPIVVLYANGERYEVSPYGGSLRIPVNKGETAFILEIGLQVKTDFVANVGGFLHAEYAAYLDDFVVHFRDYQDQNSAAILDEIKKANDELIKQTQEQQKQTEALTKYENADKMDSDNDKLTGAIGDYNEVSDSIFESAGNGMGDFDISTGFEFGSQLLSAIGFVGTIMTSIITAMEDFSILYTLGVCLVLVGVLIGLYKYFSGGGDDD